MLLCLINSFFGTFEKTQLQIEHFLEHLAKWHCWNFIHPLKKIVSTVYFSSFSFSFLSSFFAGDRHWMPLGLSCYLWSNWQNKTECSFNALTGLSCYIMRRLAVRASVKVSMPSRAWVVTARMSNILNFLWYFLCIPAIYRCILAYLPIFFNQLSKFLRCESPSTFLGTCLSHHSFIILLITSTSALLTGL